MLAYLFWHRPQPGVEREAYERAQRDFHARLGAPSASFRLDALPFGQGDGYEDWYLVDGWAELGELNAAAVDARRRPDHDRAAALVGAGWAGVYALQRGPATPPERASWTEKPRGEPTQAFVASLDADAVWRRELVLGPAPEFCLGGSGPTRARIWPAG